MEWSDREEHRNAHLALKTAHTKPNDAIKKNIIEICVAAFFADARPADVR